MEVGPITPLLIAMMVAGGGALALMMEMSSDDDEMPADGEELPDETPVEEPPEELDLGASVVELEDGRIEVELGEDETGHLYAFLNEDESDSTGTGSILRTDLTLLLVPEPIDFTETGRIFADSPEETIDGRPFIIGEDEYFTRANFVDYFNATELGHWDLGRESDDHSPYYDRGEAVRFSSNRIDLEFVSDAPITAVRAFGGPDGFEYDIFREIDNLNDIERASAQLGTEEDETFVANKNGYVNGRGGDDLIDAIDTHVDGGSGNDTIYAEKTADELNGRNSTYGRYIDGGDGDDFLVLKEEGSPMHAWGGEGNDTLVVENGSPEVHGDQGDDTIIVRSDIEGSPALFGDQGDDTFVLLDSATIYAGEGNDTFMVWDQGLGQKPTEAPVRLASVPFDPETDQLVILIRDGEEPVSLTHENQTLKMEFANGSIGTIGIDDINPATITFQDVDEVLAAYPVDVPTT